MAKKKIWARVKELLSRKPQVSDEENNEEKDDARLEESYRTRKRIASITKELEKFCLAPNCVENRLEK